MKIIAVLITLKLTFIFSTWGENENTNKRNFKDFEDNQQVQYLCPNLFLCNELQKISCYVSLIICLLTHRTPTIAMTTIPL